MTNKKFGKNALKFVESLVLLPMVTMSGSTAHITPAVAPAPTVQKASITIASQKLNISTDGIIALSPAVDPETLHDEEIKTQAEAIDAYFKKYDMPLEGTGMVMAKVADENDLDWRLLPAISVRESTGGRNDCVKVNHNFFGWASCKVGFKSDEEAIATVGRNLGGNNPKTARHYDNKTTKEILNAYNPPSIVPKYTEQVISIMNKIGPDVMDISITTT